MGEKKEEREGVRFHALPAAEMHCRDRILRENEAPAVCSVQFLFLLVAAVLQLKEGDAGGHGVLVAGGRWSRGRAGRGA
jgi:hypothetical protein